MLTALPACPEWHMVRVITNGHWTDPVCELFSEDGIKPPTHLHIYDISRFKAGLKAKKFTLPGTLKTCSCDDPRAGEPAPF